MKKRRHHHVWQHYLRGWSSDGTTVACREGERCFVSSTTNVGVERDFYRIQALTPQDEMVVRLLINGSPEHLRESHLQWLDAFMLPGRLREIARSQSLSQEQLDAIDGLEINFEEDLHGVTETEGVQFLESLRSGDMAFFRVPEHFAVFARFLNVQTLRTSRLRERFSAIHLDLDGFDPSRVLGVLRHILSVNAMSSMTLDMANWHISLLRASESEFITGDQPVLNLRGPDDPSQPPSELEYYYPVSPEIAVLIGNSRYGSAPSNRDLTADEIHAFNARIASAAQRQLYGRSKHVLLGVQLASTP